MADKEKNFVSAVVYVHNAAARVEGFLKAVIATFENNFEHSEIICVNDSSEDDSVAVVKKLSAGITTTSITVVNMSYFHGLELSMDAGMDLAIGDFVFEFDNTDLDFDPEMIMKIYRQSLTGYDIVSASPDRREKFSSRLFYKVFDRFTSLKYNMSTESFRVLSRRVINRINSMNKTVPYRKAMYAGSGLKTANLKYEVKTAVKGTTDPNENRYRRSLAVDTLILFTDFGYRISFVMTSAMMLISMFMIVYTLVVYLIGNPIEGWTTTALFLSFGFFGLFAILTVIVKYLQIIVDMVFKRKHYSFESIEKLTK